MNIVKLQTGDKNTRKGYTLLFAVITAALVLGVAVFILSVSKKQYALSVAARDSMYALYAADSGIECTTATDTSTSSAGSAATIRIHCNNGDSTPATFAVNGTPDRTLLWPGTYPIYQANDMIVDLPGGTCAKVTVADGYFVDPADSQIKHKTIIDSRGYNFCDLGLGPKASFRTVERALRLTYR